MSKTLAELHCDLLTIRFDFDEKVFDTKKFIRTAGLDPKLPVNVGAVSGNERGDEHLHISLDIDGADSSLILNFHRGSIFSENSGASNLISSEVRLAELGAVFNVKKLTGTTISKFVFPDGYLPLIFLGYPLSGHEGMIGGATVSGQQLSFGAGLAAKKALITFEDGILSVTVNSERTVKFPLLHPETLAAKDAEIVRKLVRKSTYVDS